jgi:hypothetical protein
MIKHHIASSVKTLVKYNFDHGAATWTQSPSPNAGQTAPTQTFTYDSAARLQRITNGVNGAYKRFVYWSDGLQMLSWESVNNAADDHYSVTTADGAGRPTNFASENPNSAGGYTGQALEYDVMGRVKKQSTRLK